MANDIDLIKRYAAGGDPEAFAELVRRYAGMVYGACLRVTRDAHDAEDAAQECFLDLARNAGVINTSLSGWLHTKAISRATDALRRVAARKRHEEKAMSERESATEPSWTEVAPLIDEAMADLPDELRAALLMHYFRGTPQAEIAQELGVNQSTVSRRLNDAIAQVRERLAKSGVALPATSLSAMLAVNGLTTAPATLTAAAAKLALTHGAKAGIAKAGVAKVVAGKSMAAAGSPLLAKLAVGLVVVSVAAVASVRISRGAPASTPLKVATAAMPAPAFTPKEDAPPPKLATATAPVAAAEAPDLIGRLNVLDGEWQDIDGARAGAAPLATLISANAYDSDALVVEFDARAEDFQNDGALICSFSPYKNRAEEVKGKIPVISYQLKIVWPSLALSDPQRGKSRDMDPAHGWGDLTPKAGDWYHLKAEAYGKIQRFWINGVLIREHKLEKDPSPTLYVMLGASQTLGSFKKLNIYRPDDAAIKQNSTPSANIAAPYQQVQEILAKFPDTVAREATVDLGETNKDSGLTEVPYKGATGTPAEFRGVACRRTDAVLHPDVWGLDFRLQTPADWNPSNTHRLEVEFLDRGNGVVIVRYNCWTGSSTASAALPRANSGKWVRKTIDLPEASFSENAPFHFWIGAFQTSEAEQDLWIHSLKMIEISKPKEAHQAVADELTKHLEAHKNDWLAPHYKFRLAQTLAYHLDRDKDAQELMTAIEKDTPTTDVLGLYRAMCRFSPAWQIGKSAEAKKMNSDF